MLDAHAPGYAVLLARMVHVDPARRPNTGAALAQSRALQVTLDPWAPEEGYLRIWSWTFGTTMGTGMSACRTARVTPDSDLQMLR